MPDVSVECSSNVVHLRTCVDSCTALRDVLVYLATKGDLQPRVDGGKPLRDYTSLGSEHSLLSTQVPKFCVGNLFYLCILIIKIAPVQSHQNTLQYFFNFVFAYYYM